MRLNRVNLKWKVTGLACGAVALTLLLLGSAIAFLVDKYIRSSTNSLFEAASQNINTLVDTRARSYLFLATTYARAPTLIGMLSRGDRAGMLSILNPQFKQLQNEFSIDVLHYHTPEGRSFVRVHQPENFGDMLADIRPMIAKVNEARSTAQGIEWGVNGLVIRGMRAIVTDNGAHLGSVEVGSLFTDRLLNEWVGPDRGITIYSKRPAFRGDSSPLGLRQIATSVGRTQAYLAPKDMSELGAKSGTIRWDSRDDGAIGLSKTYPLFDWSGAHIGYMQIFVAAQEILKLRVNIALAIGALTLLCVVIVFLLARQLIRTVSTPIEAMSASIESIRNNNLDSQVSHQNRDDEIGNIARQLEALRLALILARRKEALLHHRDRLQSLGDMTGRIAHEINNLLQPIRLTVELLHDAPLAEPIRAQVGTIGRTVERVRVLIADILCFARRDQTLDMRDEVGAINLDEAMRTSLALVIASLRQGEAINAADSWPSRSICCDAAGLSQVILNICRNGFDAMGGTGTINIAADVVEITTASSKSAVIAVGQYVLIAIHDHGPGIPPEVLDRMFEPFFTTKPVGKGTGLGLSIAYSMVQEWGGHIGVRTQLGVGTTFEIYLAVRNAPTAVDRAGSENLHSGISSVSV
jgi:signal transduction histidine kinase